MKKDKIKHVIAGLIIFLLGWYFFNSGIGLAFAVGIGIVKELNDEYKWFKFLLTSKNSKMDTWDILATIAIPFVITIIEYFIN